jgi:hypothetical protein
MVPKYAKSDNWGFPDVRDPQTGSRRGWYLNCDGGEAILEITFHGMDNELGLFMASN